MHWVAAKLPNKVASECRLCAPYALDDAAYLSTHENTVFYFRRHSWFPKLPAGEGDSRVVRPVK